MIQPENPITELADGLRAAVADVATRTPLLAPVVSLILTSLDLLLRRLESLFAAWQAGTLPALRQPAPAVAPATPHTPAPPAARNARIRTRALVARRRPLSADPDSIPPAAATLIIATNGAPHRPFHARPHTRIPACPAARPTPEFNFRPPGPTTNPRLNRSA